MLKEAKAFSSFSVDDLEAALKFYSEKLGIKMVKTPMGMLIYPAGGGEIYIYPKPNHVPATFTVLNFEIDNIDDVVDHLTGLGIKFEKYEGEIKTDEKGIVRADKEQGPRGIAWFKDPAGNILSIIQEK